MAKTHKDEKISLKGNKSGGGENQAILVAGGSGFIGKHLVKHLSKCGETVVSMYHHRLPEPMQNVFPVCSDLSSVELLGAPLRGVKSVVYLAWENSFIGPDQEWDVDLLHPTRPPNVKMLENLLRAMEHTKTRRIVFISANGAKKNAKNSFLREKYHAELAVLNSSIPEKIIIRSAIVWGDKGSQDRFIRSILGVMRVPWFYPVPESKKTIAPLHIDDIVDLIDKALKQQLKDPCAILEFVGKESYRVDELFRLIAQNYNGKSKIQVKGHLGDWLIKYLFENKRNTVGEPKLSDYLALSSQVDKEVAKRNPFQSNLGFVEKGLNLR